MRYRNVQKAEFLDRPNRFIAHARLNGETVVCHVKNTGRCRELLVPGAVIYLEESDKPTRKTRYDLIAVEKEREHGRLLINMDAQAPNQVFREWALEGHFHPELSLLQGERQWGNSRFDFYFEAGGEKGFVEVKGVTLERDGHALFPDAPTARGVKHLEELVKCRAAGYRTCVCFVIQMAGMTDFSPNDATHPAFGAALRRAAEHGVELLARECRVSPDALTLAGAVPVRL